MITIKKNQIPIELKSNPIILYGAGFAGRQCKRILQNTSIDVKFFIDDDITKWGKNIEGLPVYSFDELITYAKTQKQVYIVLTSIYGIQISSKLKKISNVIIYEMYDWYTEFVMPERYGKNIYDALSLKQYKENVESLKKYLSDDESYHVFQNLYQYMVTGEIHYITEISTMEEQYFIKEVLDFFSDRAFTIVDAGAYEGELIRAIYDLKLNVKEWFCFETNKENYQQLMKNSTKNYFKGKQICINKGLWNEITTLHVQGDGTSSKVTANLITNDTVEMTTMDSYFHDITVDLIKMDIEGAEMNALRGGLNIIKRDRPVLAISIYHSVQDYYDIMKLLINELPDYKYYVRHHSMVFCETVLYAIPV